MTPSDAPETPLAAGPAEPTAGDLAPPAPAWDTRRLWTAALAAGVVAGAIAGLGGEAAYGFFPSPQATGPFGSMTAEEIQLQVRADILNATLAFGPLGAVLGLALGLAGGFVRRSGRAAAVAGGTGLVVGGLLATGATAVLMLIRQRLLQTADESDLLVALMTHGGIWAAVGAG